MLGSPIAHSKSPVLHGAAYAELGLTDWTYERIECTADRFSDTVDELGDDWVGLSVTMPNKFAALAHAVERTERAVAVGSANTLVRVDGGWRADCTDIDGVTGALGTVGVHDLTGEPVVVVGAGGTSRPALVALRHLGAESVTVVARDRARAEGAAECARDAGLDAVWSAPDAPSLPGRVADAAVVVSTIPPDGAAAMTDALAGARVLLDAIYHPWPTPLAHAVEASGGVVVGGLQMLLHQAFGQVEQFTGLPAPREAMERALLSVV